MQSAFVRDRLERCRGELSQVIGLARDLERLEVENARSAGTAANRWSAPGTSGSGTFSRPEFQATSLLQRIQQAADRCGRTLGEVERELESLQGAATPAGIWEQPSYGGRRGYSSYGAGAPQAWNAQPAWGARREYAAAGRSAWERDSAYARTPTAQRNGYSWRRPAYEPEHQYAGAGAHARY
jgi:hypothetical protein